MLTKPEPPHSFPSQLRGPGAGFMRASQNAPRHLVPEHLTYHGCKICYHFGFMKKKLALGKDPPRQFFTSLRQVSRLTPSLSFLRLSFELELSK